MANVKKITERHSSNNFEANIPHNKRMRRLRNSKSLRNMVQETHLGPADFIYPIFVEENLTARTEISSMPGIYRETEETLADKVKEAYHTGVEAIILFGVSHNKDECGSDSLSPNGLLARMIRTAKEAAPEITVIADLCFCEYTDHGHCGVLTEAGDVDNDLTLINLAEQALIAVNAGADMVAPSGMMDGKVATIRESLDENGFTHIPIMAYSTKFASNFYGPFRDAAGCGLGKGAGQADRKTYQMNPANGREALLESIIDEEEGADILMVKPGMPYLDVLTKIREQTLLPLAAYQVSGEYAMIKYAAKAGAINETEVMMESLIAFKRAGADLILSYFSLDAIEELQKK